MSCWRSAVLRAAASGADDPPGRWLPRRCARSASTGDLFSSAIRLGDWKFLDFLDENRVELYNLATDPGESKNLATEHTEDRDCFLVKTQRLA